MNLTKNIKNFKNAKNSKKGSYIVEAAISMPVFILCIIAIALIINIIAECENIGFQSARRMHMLSAGTETAKITAFADLASLADKHRLRTNVTAGGIDELLELRTESEFNVKNPIGIKGKISFTQQLRARAFTGKSEDAKPLPAAEFQKNEKSVPVVIFPKYGRRFHTAECRYATKNYNGEEYKIEMEKEDAEAKGYTPCLVCGGGEGKEKNYE